MHSRHELGVGRGRMGWNEVSRWHKKYSETLLTLQGTSGTPKWLQTMDSRYDSNKATQHIATKACMKSTFERTDIVLLFLDSLNACAKRAICSYLKH
jgi:hypothetical protein